MTTDALKNINIAALQKHLESTDPYKAMESIGYTREETDVILQGNFDVVKNKVFDAKRAVNFYTVLNTYGSALNIKVCALLFDRIKNKTDFSENELTAYQTVFEKLIHLFFESCKAFVFMFEELPNVKNILIKKDDDTYLLSLCDDNRGTIQLL